MLNIAILAIALIAVPIEVEFSVLSEGSTDRPIPLETPLVIENNAGLAEAWTALGLEGAPPGVDFGTERVVLVVDDSPDTGAVKVITVKRQDDNIEVVYYIHNRGKNTSALPAASRYVLAKFETGPGEPPDINIRWDRNTSQPGVGIGQGPVYTSILHADSEKELKNYIPLDKGNEWTYRVVEPSGTSELTFRVLSFSQEGWSLFDSFFGRENVALKVQPRGDLMVLSNSALQPFYTPETSRIYSSVSLSTPAGSFDDLLVFSETTGLGFSFKDVYAKGIGLVYHEHEDGNGKVSYTLIKAGIRGRSYPATLRQ